MTITAALFGSKAEPVILYKVELDGNDWILPRAAAAALATGGRISKDFRFVVGGNPNSLKLPTNARELTPSEYAESAKHLRKSRGEDTDPKWLRVTKVLIWGTLELAVLTGAAYGFYLLVLHFFVR